MVMEKFWKIWNFWKSHNGIKKLEQKVMQFDKQVQHFLQIYVKILVMLQFHHGKAVKNLENWLWTFHGNPLSEYVQFFWSCIPLMCVRF